MFELGLIGLIGYVKSKPLGPGLIISFIMLLFVCFCSGPATYDKHICDCLFVVSTINLLGPGRTPHSTHFNIVVPITPWGVVLSPIISSDCLFCPMKSYFWSNIPLRAVFVARYFFYRRYICLLTGCSWHAWDKCLCEIKKSNDSVGAFLQQTPIHISHLSATAVLYPS